MNLNQSSFLHHFPPFQSMVEQTVYIIYLKLFMSNMGLEKVF